MSIVNIITLSTNRMNILNKLQPTSVGFSLCSPKNRNIIAIPSKRKLTTNIHSVKLCTDFVE
jgi:hypothetical protein